VKRVLETIMKTMLTQILATLVATWTVAAELPYAVVDTGQERCYDTGQEIAYPAAGAAFFGQDAQYQGAQPAYQDNRDGTITDKNTGLIWQKNPGQKMTYDQAAAGAAKFKLAGHSDWRLPTIKELYSLIDFSGCDPRVQTGGDTSGLRPFINTNFFPFQYGKESEGDRIIDSQYASSTLYVGPATGSPMGLGGSPASFGNYAEARKMFGVNFADGRIKGYGLSMPGRGEKTFYVMYVRGNPAYGGNHFVDNRNGTITDTATGLTWQQGDSGKGMDWRAALAYAGNLKLARHEDWRLPNAKELQSIVDYTRAPGKTRSAAIDPVFRATAISNELGELDFPCYWTGTTHQQSNGRGGAAAYIAFGRAMGCMRGNWVDVHGSGAQRSDPKAGNPADFPQGRGPQGDAIRIFNFVRCVRGGLTAVRTAGPAVQAAVGGEEPEGFGPPPMGSAAGDRPRGFVRRLDRNGDGKVSPEEFDGPPEHFPVLDKNGDGFLTNDEAPPPPFQRQPGQ
jgi:hypothetical protein